MFWETGETVSRCSGAIRRAIETLVVPSDEKDLLNVETLIQGVTICRCQTS